MAAALRFSLMACVLFLCAGWLTASLFKMEVEVLTKPESPLCLQLKSVFTSFCLNCTNPSQACQPLAKFLTRVCHIDLSCSNITPGFSACVVPPLCSGKVIPYAICPAGQICCCFFCSQEQLHVEQQQQQVVSQDE